MDIKFKFEAYKNDCVLQHFYVIPGLHKVHTFFANIYFVFASLPINIFKKKNRNIHI